MGSRGVIRMGAPTLTSRPVWLTFVAIIGLAVATLGIAAGPLADIAMATDRQSSFVVNGFRFSGNASIASETLQGLVKSARGKTTSISDLEVLAAQITEYYRAQGYLLAQAYVPPQTITRGIVHIAMVEGRYGAISVSGEPSLRTDVVEAHLRQLQPGSVVMRGPLERATLLLAALPGVDAEATLRAGEAPGTTDLDVSLRDAHPLNGSVVVDNHGGRASGRLRGAVNIQWNNPRGYADQLVVSALSSGADLGYGRIAYEAPVNYRELRLLVAYAASEYALGDVFSGLGATGESRSLNLTLRYPLVRSEGVVLEGLASYSASTLADAVDGLDVTHRRAGVTRVAFQGERRLPAGLNAVGGLTLDSGVLEFENAAAKAQDQATARTEGAYHRVVGNLSLTQPLGSAYSLSAAIGGQLASKNLDSTAKLALGGPDAIRAYGSSEASGDEGWMGRVELRRALTLPWLPGTMTGSAFLEGGRIRVNKTVWPGAGAVNARSLYGVGAGLAWRWGSVSTQLAYAVPVGAIDPDLDRNGRLWWQSVWQY